MPRIDLDGVALNYAIDGGGDKVVILINGLTMELNGWFLQVPAFSKNYKLLRYDCRGQGQSDKPEAQYSQELHADDLKNLMDKLEIKKAHIAGLSNGGMIAQHFALKYPERVGALVLIDTCSHVDTLLTLILNAWIKVTETGGSELRYDVALPALFGEEFVNRNLEAILSMRDINIQNNQAAAVINLAKASRQHNVKDRISQIKAPTLIIVGDEDILIPPKYSKFLNEKIQGSKLVIIKNCGHVPPIEKTEEFNTVTLDFLKDHDGLLR